MKDGTSDFLNEVKATIPKDMENLFTIFGSSLHFKYRPYNEDWRWKNARCVEKGKILNLDKSRISILTQGTHAITPYLDLPYFVHFHGDIKNVDDISYSIISRLKGPNENDRPIIDVRNPYKPVRSQYTIADMTEMGTWKSTYPLQTPYGTRECRIIEVSTKNVIKVFIPDFNVIANVFLTTNSTANVGRGFCPPEFQGGLALQCMFNVGNSFAQSLYFPTKGPCDNYIARPIVSLLYGDFTEQGLWTEELAVPVEGTGEIDFLQNFRKFTTGN